MPILHFQRSRCCCILGLFFFILICLHNKLTSLDPRKHMLTYVTAPMRFSDEERAANLALNQQKTEQRNLFSWVIVKLDVVMNPPQLFMVCAQLKAMFPGWNVVIYPVTSSISRHQDCFMLSKQNLSSFGVSVTVSLPFENLAFLYAIKNGAELIYAVNFPKVYELSDDFAFHVSIEDRQHLLPKLADTERLISPNHCSSMFTLMDSGYPLVQVQISSIDCPLNPQVILACRNQLPNFLSTSNGMYFHKNAFWALGNHSDFHLLLYGLELLNTQLLISRTSKPIYKRNFIKICNGHSYKDCTSSLLLSCLELNSKQIINVKWFQALEKIGYNFPVVSSLFLPSKSQAFFHPPSLSFNMKQLAQTCPNIHPRVNLNAPWVSFVDITLVIVFNNPLYQIIPFVDVLYRPFFPNIIYCGPGRMQASYPINFIRYKPTPVGHQAGSFNYECVNLVQSLRLSTNGFLFIADDVLLSPHKVSEMDKTKPWFIPHQDVLIANVKTLHECRLGMCNFYPHWHWWEDYQSQVLSALDRLGHHSNLSAQCLSSLFKYTKGRDRAAGAHSDVFYLPKNLISKFSAISQLFLEEQVFLEVAVPTILYCLTSDIEEIKGLIMWGEYREMPWDMWKTTNILGKTFIHPTKWSKLLQNVSPTSPVNNFYCQQVLPWMHDKYGRLTVDIN